MTDPTRSLSTGAEIARLLDADRSRLCEAIVERLYRERPELAERYGERGRAHCLKDTEYHLSYLGEALAAGAPSLFADYVGWAKVLLSGYRIPEEDLALNLTVLRESLVETLPEEAGARAVEFIDAGLKRLPDLPSELPTYLHADEPLAELSQEFLDALLRGDRNRASRLILDAVENGVGIRDIYLHVFQRSQYEIGRLWQMNRITVAQEHFCTAATQLIMSQLYPALFSTRRKGCTFVAACVGGDLHEIGMRMVADFMEMEGWDTFYLGANTPASGIVQTALERSADVLGLSATMTYHVRRVGEVIAALRSEERGRNVKALVGGYPFQVEPELWRQVGADGYAGNAQEAVVVANRLVGG